MHFSLSGGQASDISHAQPLLDGVQVHTGWGKPRKRCRKLWQTRVTMLNHSASTAIAIACNLSFPTAP